MTKRFALTWAIVASVSGCATAKPPPPPPPRPPAGPIVFPKIERVRPTHYELRFTPDRSYAGLEVQYELLDANKQVVHADKIQVGGIFEGGRNRLVRGRRVARRLSRPSDQIKVVGRRRSIRSPLDQPEIDLASVRSARLVHVFSCRRERYGWRPGLPIPEGVNNAPRLGTVFMHNVCRRSFEARAGGVRRTFHFERYRSRTRGTLKLLVQFERDFPRGVSFALELLDGAGKVLDPRCAYSIRQPKVYQGTGIDYTIDMQGAYAVSVLERIRAVRARDVRPHAGGARELTLRRICR